MARPVATTGDADKPLTEGERNIVDLHLRGMTLREIELQAGMDHSGVARVLKRPNVEAYIDRCRRDADDALRRRYVHAGPRMVDVLVKIAESPESTEGGRISAAAKVLERTTALRVALGGDDPDRPIRIASDLRTATEEELQAIVAGEG